jgi:isocitrate dehydrogenase
MATSITMGPDGLIVPADPIIPFIEGDGIGPDIWAASVRVFDAAVKAAFAGRERSRGKSSSPGRRRSMRPVHGFPTRRSMPSGTS